MTFVTIITTYNLTHDDVALCVVKQYLTINQHDDSYTILDKMKHLLVGHCVRNDVQSLPSM
jgi:hypothetical protein